ncbi:hypothetical protein FACS189488_12910 [Betaproteobacteria bacterium]|nr:hypothetical protein FACS189488_12910 [Betaproteobacteria bacterium]
MGGEGVIPFCAQSGSLRVYVFEFHRLAGGEFYGVAVLVAPEVLSVDIQLALLGEFQEVACADVCAQVGGFGVVGAVEGGAVDEMAAEVGFDLA